MLPHNLFFHVVQGLESQVATLKAQLSETEQLKGHVLELEDLRGRVVPELRAALAAKEEALAGAGRGMVPEAELILERNAAAKRLVMESAAKEREVAAVQVGERGAGG
jgi:hypothetical protein